MKMKTTPQNTKNAGSPKPVRQLTPSDAAKDDLSSEWLSFTPEAIKTRASATSKVMNSILERGAATYRHWGINE